MALKAFVGGSLFGTLHGDAPPAVLALHGWGRTGADFEGVLAGIDSLALDLPGFGASPVPPEPWGAAGYAGAIAPILDEFDAPPVVVGHSFGGRVAVHLACLRPVASLVLVGVPLLRPGGKRPGPPLGFRLAKTLHRFGLLGDQRMEHARRTHGSADYRAAEGVMRDILVRVVNESYEEQLDRLDVPVRMLWGAADRAAPVETASRAYERLKARNADVTLEVFEEVGHDLHLDRPDILRAALGGSR